MLADDFVIHFVVQGFGREDKIVKTATPLVQPFLPPEISKRSDVSQGECEAKEIFVAHIRDRIAAIFEGHSAAIPVISRLGRSELQLPQLCVETDAGGGAEPTAREVSVAESGAELLESASRNCGRSGKRSALPDGRNRRSRRELLWNLQECVSCAEGEWPEIVVDQKRTGIDAAELKVVIQVPLSVGMAAGIDAQPRNNGREMARFGREGDAREIFGGSENIALPGNQRTAKIGVEEVFLGEFPGDDLAHIRGGCAGWIIEICQMSPGDELFRGRRPYG
jgi:hypothetical protein